MKLTGSRTVFLAVAIFLVIVYGVGIVGLGSGYSHYFVALTPYTLVLTLSILLAFHRQYNPAFISFAAIAFAAGFLVEIAGVHTGFIFGSYTYGTTLGPKLWDVPLVMGVNWLMLVYCCGIITSRLRYSVLSRAFLGAIMMTALDILIEPVAVKLSYWTWADNLVPVQNYLAWFICSFLLIYLFHRLTFVKENKLAPVVFILQLIFFFLMNIM